MLSCWRREKEGQIERKMKTNMQNYPTFQFCLFCEKGTYHTLVNNCKCYNTKILMGFQKWLSSLSAWDGYYI